MEKYNKNATIEALKFEFSQYVHEDITRISDMPKTIKELKKELKTLLRFAKEVNAKDQEIDPNKEYDWESLTLGFLLGCGITISRAQELAIWIRYNTNLA